MAPSEAMLAHHYNPAKVDLRSGWGISRKLNGFRGILKVLPDGTKGLFSLGRYSGSKPIWAPKWWLDKLPALPLDGEIWHSSDDLAFVKSIAGQGKDKSFRDSRWEELTYQAFDVRNDLPWHKRQNMLACFDDNHICQQVEQDKVYCDEDVKIYLDRLGPQVEGVMLANPYGYYEYTRSHSILKHKRAYDAEARVVGYEDGAGKHEGRVGALQVILTWDEKISTVKGGTVQMTGRMVSFKIGGGLSDQERDKEYYRHCLAGKVIKFSYLGVSSYGIPQSPNFVEVLS